MSLNAIAWAMDARKTGKLAAEHRLVLLVLAECADVYGNNAWPSKGTISERIGCSDSAVKRALRTLESRGLIARSDQRLVAHVRPDRRPTVWCLRIEDAPAPSLDMLPTLPLPSSTGGSAVTPRPGVSSDPPSGSRGVTCDPHGGSAVTPKPTTKPTYSTVGSEGDPSAREAHRPRCTDCPADHDPLLSPCPGTVTAEGTAAGLALVRDQLRAAKNAGRK